MSRGAKMTCDKCGADITMEGARICRVCDPDLKAIMDRQVDRNTPELCEKCFEIHQAQHGEATSNKPPAGESPCRNCGNCEFNQFGNCLQCGVGPQIG